MTVSRSEGDSPGEPPGDPPGGPPGDSPGGEPPVRPAGGHTLREPCPRCSRVIEADERFVRWCPACEWNVDPRPQPPPASRFERRAAQAAADEGPRLLAEVSLEPEVRLPRDPARLRVWFLALAVHLVTAALVGAGVALAVAAWPGVIGVAVGVVLAFAGLALGPRPRRGDPGVAAIDLCDASALAALVGEVAAAVGTAAPERFEVDASFGSDLSTTAIRRRTTVRMGAPLWVCLDPQQRVAMLAHVLAHPVRGDSANRRFVASADESLRRWVDSLTDEAPARERRGVWGDGLNRAAIAGARRIAVAQLRRLRTTATTATQRAEYRADEIAARVAGREALTGALETLLLADRCTSAARRGAAGGQDPWAAARRAIADVPGHERERLRRLSRRRGQAWDDPHPPTAHRLAFARTRADLPAQVACPPERAVAVAAEVHPALATVAGELQARVGA
ncbi:MAG: M48 family metalloprotease [Actinobacteria bacterium]|nr:M48 family metalloprotease [Actinomycetota bacterium]